MERYEILIYWSDEDAVCVAEVPELPGCMAHGGTYDEALTNIREAMSFWIETANQDGVPIHEPKGRRLLFA
jgi:predicted RNase H-like HicB family nuclease